MGNVWITKYEGHEIKVRNSWILGESLFVDNQLQDKAWGLFGSANLYGIIKDGKDEQKITVRLTSGLLTVKCSIFINGKSIFTS